MIFDFVTERFESGQANLDCYLVPWDTEILGFPVGQIAQISLGDPVAANTVLDAYFVWKHEKRINFASCRFPHERFEESFLLQRRGYHFIELNYQPRIRLNSAMLIEQGQFEFDSASLADRGGLVNLAGELFQVGRFHSDPMLGSEIGNARYRAWMDNAFELPHQEVVKCTIDGHIGAFFVVENEENFSHWSLVGLHPSLQGKGIGKRIWQAMMSWQYKQGVEEINTSISSLNTPVLNLYVSLGFRFPSPQVTLHWHREEH